MPTQATLRYAIITYEGDENFKTWTEVLAHIFYGQTLDEIQAIIAAHRKSDAFFNGSFLGHYEDIPLKNEIIGLI
jgi:hypothetical protein